MTYKNLIFALFFLILTASCGNKNAQQNNANAAVPVATDTVETQNVSYYDEYPATVVALQQTVLTPQVNGYITGIFFKEGEHVKKGQKLYSIDAQMYDANFAQAEANVAVQEANLTKAQKDADRYHALAKNDAVARQLVDDADAGLVAAQKQVAAAQSAVKSIQTSVRYTTITAPFDGTIGISQVRLGASVSSGSTVLNTISSDDPMAVDIVIDQSELFRFEKLRSATAKDSTFMLAFGNDDIYPHYGYISTIDRAVDALTATIKTRLTFSNKENLLRAGMSGTLRVLNNSSEASLLIPYKAVIEQLGEFFVYVVKGETVTQTRVVLGKAIGKNVVIKNGLQAGDIIVIEGVQTLKEGSAITTAQPKPVETKK